MRFFPGRIFSCATLSRSRSSASQTQELSKQEFLSVLLRCLRNKAVQGSFEDEAQELLELFEERLRQGVDGAETFENDLEDPGCSETKATPPFEGVPAEASKGLAKISNLERALNRMTFFSVASLTTRAQFEKDRFERLRQVNLCNLFAAEHRRKGP
eukprot:g19092.t2